MGINAVMCTAYPSADGHVHFRELNVSKFMLDSAAQRLLVCIQHELLDHQYAAFGKTEGSWDK